MKTVLLCCLTILVLSMARPTVTVYYLSDFGATGLGDETAKIQNALNAGGGGTLIEVRADPSKTYQFSTPLTFKSNVTFDGLGATLKMTSGAAQLAKQAYIRAVATVALSDTSNLQVTAGSNKVFTHWATSLHVGRLVWIEGGSFGTSGYKHGYYDLVTAISGNSVTLLHSAVYSFQALRINEYVPLTNIAVRNWRLDFTNRTDGYGLAFYNTIGMTVQNVTVLGTPVVDNALRMGIFMQGAFGLVDRCRVIGGKLNDSGDAVAYGINVGGQNITVQYCYVADQKHQITSANRNYNARGIKLRYDTCDNQAGWGAQMDFHGQTWGEMRGNVLAGHSAPNSMVMEVRSDSTLVIDNTITYDNLSSAPITTVRGIGIHENAVRDIFILRNKIWMRSQVANTNLYAINTLGGSMAPLTTIHIEGNLISGGVVLTGSWGSDNYICRNFFDAASAGYFPYINVVASAFSGPMHIDDNTGINRTSGTANSFLVHVGPTVMYAGSTVARDTCYKTVCTNTRNQFVVDAASGITATACKTFGCTTTAPLDPLIPPGVPPVIDTTTTLPIDTTHTNPVDTTHVTPPPTDSASGPINQWHWHHGNPHRG